MEFLDVKTDFAFKKVFGSSESKDILISFLNSIIDFGEKEKIVDLTIMDPYLIPMIMGMKDTFVDVKANLSNHKSVIIEMQVLNVEGFEKRILYNAAKTYSTQLMKAEAFSTLEPIIALTITDFIMFEETENVISCFKLIDKETFIKYNDEIELIFIELPKFNKTEDELETIKDKWIYFIKNAGMLEYKPKTLIKEAQIEKAFEIANTASMTREELEAQHKRHDFIYCQKGALSLALKQGLQQGRQEGRIEVAKILSGLGTDIETISKATGLSREEIEGIEEMSLL
ncbi:Rpn family recombination-promoting nuclease/putative transposase [Candidatus Desantisbacteria bacterium]|nr:Rpn family recombination-promoting nuclease/putative transposase [Candidatus Desantisbacteria bacterium]